MEFEQFFSATRSRLVGSIFLVVGDLGEAEDVTQEAYSRAARNWPKIRDYEDPEGWLRRVALNLALSSLARARRRAVSVLTHQDRPVEFDATTATVLAVDVRRALLQLPRRYRAVIVLHYLDDRSVAQVATDLGLPVETVRSQLARGRRRLHELLGDGTARTETEHLS